MDNWNIQSGFYRTTTNSVGLPLSNNGNYVIHCNWDINAANQIFLSYASDLMAFRRKENNVWKDWKTIAFTDSNVASARTLTHSNGTVGAVVENNGNIVFKQGSTVYQSGGANVAYYGTAQSGLGSSYDGALMYAYHSKPLYFYTGAVRMLINSSGNVLIGTSTDDTSHKVQIDGNLKVYESSQRRFYTRFSSAGMQCGVDTSLYTGGWNGGVTVGADNSSLGYVAGTYSEGGTINTYFYGGLNHTTAAMRIDSSTKAVTMSNALSVGGNITPSTTNSYSLGTYGTYFKTGHINIVSSGAVNNNLWLVGGNGTLSSGIQFAHNADGSASGQIGSWNSYGLYPATNNTYNLGTSSNQWLHLYAAGATFSGNCTLTGTLTIKRSASVLEYQTAGGERLGYLGFKDANVPCIYENDGKTYHVLSTSEHTHSYLPLSGGMMDSDAGIKWPQSTSSTWDTFGLNTHQGIKILNTIGSSSTNAPNNYAVGLSVSGYYGFCLAYYGDGNIWWLKGNGDDTWKTILHSDNSSVSLSGQTLTVKINGVEKSLTNTDTTYSAATTSAAGLVSTGTQSFAGAKTFTSTVTATGFYESSDERLKDFEDDIDIDLNALKKIPKKYFKFKEDPTTTHIGTSAQVIKELYPELVAENEEGYLSVDYAKLSVIALSAVDELYDKYSILDNKLNELIKVVQNIQNL